MSQLGEHTPKLIAFDLDYTLWELWIDAHAVGPLKRDGNALNRVKDNYGATIGFYRDVPQILHDLAAGKIHIAACSRTSATDLANEALSLLLMPPSEDAPQAAPRTAKSFFNSREIYPGSKIQHFKAINRKTGIPYEEMLFFDDEPRNREVEKLGVTFVLANRGMNRKLLDRGLAEWRRRHPKAAENDNND